MEHVRFRAGVAFLAMLASINSVRFDTSVSKTADTAMLGWRKERLTVGLKDQSLFI
jgi:hypothetical protein